MSRTYRTLIRGCLVQQSSLCVGGASAEVGGADLQCARDGDNRLTIPGTGIAGALIETAARIFPALLQRNSDGKKACDAWSFITAKSGKWGRKGKTDAPEGETLQSLWRFSPAHLVTNLTELRQGVGIRQKTGATAAQGKALFDVETVPPGEAWQFFFEIDTLRGGAKVEAVALLALWEWTQGRCWLGANAARGLGWMMLENLEVMRLPLLPKVVDLWPDNTIMRDDAWWAKLQKATSAEVVPAAKVRERALELLAEPLPTERFWYATLDGALEPGRAESGYGWDALSVGGHAAGFLAPLSDGLLKPLGCPEEKYDPDAPVVTTGRNTQQPFVPGSGVRGPLRHAASRVLNQKLAPLRKKVPDPNENVNEEVAPDAREQKNDDAVSVLFGLTGQSARLLVRDARPAAESKWRLVWVQHHAEDEFAGGVFGSGKFDRTAVLDGRFEVRLVIEAASKDELLEHIETLKPALRLAELGHVPVGGGKTRGVGHVAWKFDAVSFGRAGDKPQSLARPKGINSASLLATVEDLIREGRA